MRGALTKVPGIGEIKIEQNKTAFSVQYDPTKCDPQKLLAAVNATPEKAKLAN